MAGSDSVGASPARYLATVGVSALLAAILIAGVNILQDPYLLFGTPRLAGLNHVYMFPRLTEARAARVNQSQADVLALGTSRTLCGLDTREHDAIFNAGLPVASMSQLETLFLAGLTRRPPARVFLVEVATQARNDVIDERPSHSGLALMARALLSLEAISNSVLIFANSARRAAQPITYDDFYLSSCDLTPSGTFNAGILAQAREDMQPSAQELAAIEATAARLAEVCQRAGPAIVVFYEPPHHPRGMAVSAVRHGVELRVSAWRGALPASQRLAPDCALHFVDLSSPEGDWGDHVPEAPWLDEHWTSITHFDGIVGDTILERLLDVATTAPVGYAGAH